MLVEVKGVSKSYRLVCGEKKSVLNDISFEIEKGDALGLLGPSGCGKSTMARIIQGILPADHGTVCFQGQNISRLSGKKKRAYFTKVQMVWQDPSAYLNPYQSVIRSITEPMASFRMGDSKSRLKKGKELMALLDLDDTLAPKKPGQLSGGQCQRVAIVRALSLSPELLILDEALVNLDLPQQVVILKRLARLRKELGLSMLFISHDRDTVKKICTRIIHVHDGVWSTVE